MLCACTIVLLFCFMNLYVEITCHMQARHPLEYKIEIKVLYDIVGTLSTCIQSITSTEKEKHRLKWNMPHMLSNWTTSRYTGYDTSS